MSDSPVSGTDRPVPRAAGGLEREAGGKRAVGRTAGEAAGVPRSPGGGSAACRCSGLGGEPLHAAPFHRARRRRPALGRGFESEGGHHAAALGSFRREHVVAAPGSRPRDRLSGYVGDLGAPRKTAVTAEKDKGVFCFVFFCFPYWVTVSWTFRGEFPRTPRWNFGTTWSFLPGSASWPSAWDLILQGRIGLNVAGNKNVASRHPPLPQDRNKTSL